MGPFRYGLICSVSLALLGTAGCSIDASQVFDPAGGTQPNTPGVPDELDGPFAPSETWPQGLDLFEVEDGFAGSFLASDGGLVSFETLRGDDYISDDPDSPPYRADVRFLDSAGRAFLLGVTGSAVIEPEWHSMVTQDLDGPDRVADFVRARAAASALSSVEVHSSLAFEHRMLVELGGSLDDEDLFDAESAGARDAAFLKKVDVFKKDQPLEDLYGYVVDHSALRYRVFQAGDLLTTRVTCNQGICADTGGMGLHCTSNIESSTADYPFQTEPCSTPYGPKDGSHLSNDVSYLQMKAVVAGTLPDDASCSDDFLRENAPSCTDVEDEVEETEPVVEDGVCVPVASLSGWTQVDGDTSELPPATQNIHSWPNDVAIGNYSAPEVAYVWTAPASVEAEIKFVSPHPTELNHDIFLLDGSGECVASAALKRGFNDLKYDVQAGKRYYVVVDGFNEDEGAFTLKFEED